MVAVEKVDGHDRIALGDGADECVHRRGQEGGGTSDVQVGDPFERNPILLRDGGCAGGEFHFVDEVDFGVGGVVLEKSVFNNAEESSDGDIHSHLFAHFACERTTRRFAELDVSTRQIECLSALGFAEQDFAVLDADAAGDRFNARAFVFGDGFRFFAHDEILALAEDLLGCHVRLGGSIFCHVSLFARCFRVQCF